MIETPEQLIARLTEASRVERVACEFGALQFRYWAGPKGGETLLLLRGVALSNRSSTTTLLRFQGGARSLRRPPCGSATPLKV